MTRLKQLWKKIVVLRKRPAPQPVVAQRAGLQFYVTPQQSIRPDAVFFASAAAFAVLFTVTYALRHNGHNRIGGDGKDISRSSGASASSNSDDKDDDPNQIDTIVMADPADAPLPATRKNRAKTSAENKDRRVHPTVLIILPRSNKDFGVIPDSPAGRVLYQWLAAFNKPSAAALVDALPQLVETDPSVVEAELALRKENGGFYLMSAKEVQPGLLVFRLRNAKEPIYETLGSMQVRGAGDSATVVSFSLRGVMPEATPTDEAEK